MPITGHFGADVTGVDLRAIDDATLAELVDRLHEHLVLFFHDQSLDDGAQLDLARRIGEPYMHPIALEFGARDALVEHIIDDEQHRPFQDHWHTDISWIGTPPTYGFLRAIELPPTGGDTCWLDARAAHDTLPDELRDRVDALAAHHHIGMGTAFSDKAGDDTMRSVREKFPGVKHPVVTTHPPSGRKCLYVNEGFTDSIGGDDGILLGQLLHHLRTPNIQLRHSWRAGDVVIWDERATQHYAVADFWSARREMARITIGAR